MKKLTLLLCFSFAFLFIGCDGDKPFFGDEVFNEQSRLPYVSIQDRNEDLEGIASNNFWDFRLVSENNGNQVKINYSTQDATIESHVILVGLDGQDLGFANQRCRFRVTRSQAVIQTITQFPAEIVITKEDVADALGISLEELESAGNVYFGGVSTDTNGLKIDLANDGVENETNGDDSIIFEEFLSCERHAYFYVWQLN